MRAPAAKRLLAALNIIALVLFGAGAAGGMSPAAAAGMAGACAHLCQNHPGADPHAAGMPGCCILSCSATAVVAPVAAHASAPSSTTAVFYCAPRARLAGLVPGTDPPPPRSFSTR